MGFAGSEEKVLILFTDGTPTRDKNSTDDCGNHIAPGFATAGTSAGDCRVCTRDKSTTCTKDSDCAGWKGSCSKRNYCKCAQAAQTEATDAKTKDGITIATIYVQPPAGVDSCKSNCYSAADYLRDKIASPGQASESEWDNINQSVGNLADKILAQLC